MVRNRKNAYELDEVTKGPRTKGMDAIRKSQGWFPRGNDV